MHNIRLTVQYDGTDFHGFQRQPGKRTVQGELETALQRLTGEPIVLHGSGRTDRGVHALGQVCHFHTSSSIPAEKYAFILRQQLPIDLLVTESQQAELDFHARRSACWKMYRYYIDTSPLPNLFQRRYRTHLPGYQFDFTAMQQAAERLKGKHDFTSFCSARTTIEDRVRIVYDCAVYPIDNGCYIEITGSGFLYNMVRIIAGTLVEVGKQKRSAQEISTILAQRDRQAAGPTLPPQGLVLYRVGYHPYFS